MFIFAFYRILESHVSTLCNDSTTDSHITWRMVVSMLCTVDRDAGCVQRVRHGPRWFHHSRRGLPGSRVHALSTITSFHRRHLPTSRPWR